MKKARGAIKRNILGGPTLPRLSLSLGRGQGGGQPVKSHFHGLPICMAADDPLVVLPVSNDKEPHFLTGVQCTSA